MNIRISLINFLIVPAIAWLWLIAFIFRCPKFEVNFGHRPGDLN